MPSHRKQERWKVKPRKSPTSIKLRPCHFHSANEHIAEDIFQRGGTFADRERITVSIEILERNKGHKVADKTSVRCWRKRCIYSRKVETPYSIPLFSHQPSKTEQNSETQRHEHWGLQAIKPFQRGSSQEEAVTILRHKFCQVGFLPTDKYRAFLGVLVGMNDHTVKFSGRKRKEPTEFWRWKDGEKLNLNSKKIKQMKNKF